MTSNSDIPSIRAVIIDDEEDCRVSLEKILKKYCPQVEILKFGCSVEESVNIIDSLRPELVFLDIALPDGNGFDVIDLARWRDFEVIFTTAHDDYALKAFEVSAVQYLMKPVSIVELIKAVERFEKGRLSVDKVESLNSFLKPNSDQIIIPFADGFKIVNIDSILYFLTIDDLTYVRLTDHNESLLINKQLNKIEESLSPFTFYRINTNYLVNLLKITSFDKGRGGQIKLSNNEILEISHRKKQGFLNAMQRIARLL